MPTRTTATRRPRKGSERVKAWVYSVLNPLMETLRAENTLLSKKNLTWRYQTAEMEFVLPTRDLVQPSARPNYDDLIRGYPSLKSDMERRDEKVRALFQTAQNCWQGLIQSLQNDIKGPLKQWKEEGNPYPGGAIPEEEFWLLIAEQVMNDLEELPYHYVSKGFWSRFRQQFLMFRIVSSFSQLEKAIAELKKMNETLIETLDQTRSHFCEEYDIPAAPL